MVLLHAKTMTEIEFGLKLVNMKPLRIKYQYTSEHEVKF